MLPSVSLTKQDFQTGSVAPSPDGILAIIAASATGTQNQAAGYFRDDLAYNDFGRGPLTEYDSYVLQVSGKPVVNVRPTASVAGALGSITTTKTGSAAITNNSSAPVDEFNILVQIVTGGTQGIAGITYQWSRDGGITMSGVTALGTASTITLGDTGVSFAIGSGTLVAGDQWQAYATRPQPNNSDLTAALAALKTTRIPWEAVLIDAVYGTGTVGVVDTWLQGLEKVGMFKMAFLSTRMKNQPAPTAESESSYATAMTSLTASDASIRVCVGTDGADCTSTLTGVTQRRPTAMYAAARAMLIPIGEDPAFVQRGNIPNATISDGNGNPKWHDEDLYPGLDDLRLTTLRSFAPGGPQGTYITNANILSSAGSDYVWVQHVRTMNKACSIAWQVLSGQLSKGVGKKPADPVTGEVYIQDQDAQTIDDLVNAALASPMKGQVAAVQYATSRTDDLSSNTSSTVNATVKLVSLAYLKKFVVQTSFTKTISAAA